MRRGGAAAVQHPRGGRAGPLAGGRLAPPHALLLVAPVGVEGAHRGRPGRWVGARPAVLGGRRVLVVAARRGRRRWAVGAGIAGARVGQTGHQGEEGGAVVAGAAGRRDGRHNGRLHSTTTLQHLPSGRVFLPLPPAPCRGGWRPYPRPAPPFWPRVGVGGTTLLPQGGVELVWAWRGQPLVVL